MENMIALINALAALTEAVQNLSEKITGEYLETFEKISEETTENQKQPKSEKTPEKSVTFEELRALLADKSRNGHTEAVRAIISKHGASKLSELKPEVYAQVYSEAEVLT